MIRTAFRNGAETHERRFSRTEQNLRNHYFGLAQQVNQWCEINGLGTRYSIGVTSGGSGTGVSTVALNLAIASAAQSEEVLLLQADLGRPFAARRLKTLRQPGFADLLLRKSELDDCIQKTPYDSLSVIGVGKSLKSDVMALPLHRVSEVMEALRMRFSMIVVDLPRATPITPCFPIVRHLDGVVMVVEQDGIDPTELARTRNQLTEAKAEIIGVVVNKKHS